MGAREKSLSSKRWGCLRRQTTEGGRLKGEETGSGGESQRGVGMVEGGGLEGQVTGAGGMSTRGKKGMR